MDYNEWSNHTAIGYLKYDIDDYNRIASKDNELRPLIEAEARQLIGSMKYVFDMKTLKEAYNKG